MTATFDGIAAWLPPDVVDTVATTMPCPRAADHRHLWQEERIVRGPDGRIVEVRRDDPYWWCEYCRITTRTRPALPAMDWPYPLIRAEEIP